jgi:hypothetical protein
MQFLVQYASAILPVRHLAANGEAVWQSLLTLQDDLIQKREAAIMTLAKAFLQLYPEQKPESVS